MVTDTTEYLLIETRLWKPLEVISYFATLEEAQAKAIELAKKREIQHIQDMRTAVGQGLLSDEQRKEIQDRTWVVWYQRNDNTWESRVSGDGTELMSTAGWTISRIAKRTS